jgi:hypothetical protein
MARQFLIFLIFIGISAQATAQEGRRVVCIPQNPIMVTSVMHLPVGVREYLLRNAEQNNGVADVGTKLGKSNDSDGPKERLVLAKVGPECTQVTVEYATRLPSVETFIFYSTNSDWTLISKSFGYK